MELLQPVNNPTAPIRGADNKSFRERLVDLFKPTDIVQIINPDSEPVTWGYLPADKEHISFAGEMSTVPMQIVDREDPEIYVLQPGQRAPLIGANAYIAIEAIAKQMIAHEAFNRQPDVAPGQARKFNFTDGVAQEKMINMIYLGKNMPTLPAEPVKNDTAIDDALGLSDDTEPKASPGRPRKAPQAS